MNHFLAIPLDDLHGYLSESDSHHAERVLRLQIGQKISVSYGKGKVYLAEIIRINKKSVQFKVLEIRRHQSINELHLAIAPTKSNDRYEWFLEKATELGIKRISPIISEHSERKVLKRERGLRIIEAAFKQSHKGFLPQLDEVQSFSDFLKSELPKQRLIATLNEGRKVSMAELDYNSECLILIGPEGDFSQSETKLALDHNFKHLDLGSEVLRTETAALQSVGIWNYEKGKL